MQNILYDFIRMCALWKFIISPWCFHFSSQVWLGAHQTVISPGHPKPELLRMKPFLLLFNGHSLNNNNQNIN